MQNSVLLEIQFPSCVYRAPQANHYTAKLLAKWMLNRKGTPIFKYMDNQSEKYSS